MSKIKITARPKAPTGVGITCIDYYYKGVLIAFSAGLGHSFNWCQHNINFPEINALMPLKTKLL